MFAYINDILIASGDVTSHKWHLHKVLQYLSHYGFRLNLAKCVFVCNHINFLAHHTDADGIAPLPEEITSIQDFPVPMPIKHRRCFIGIVDFYLRFIPYCSSILNPLKKKLPWRVALNTHFTQLKPHWRISPSCLLLKIIHRLESDWQRMRPTQRLAQWLS